MAPNPQAVAAPAAPQARSGIYGTPVGKPLQDDQYAKLFQYYQRMGGKYRNDPRKFKELMVKAAADGVSRQELGEMFGFDINKEAWHALTGKDGNISLDALQSRMKYYADDYMEMTDTSFEYFADSHIVLIPGDTLAGTWQTMTPPERRDFVKWHQQDLVELMSKIERRNIESVSVDDLVSLAEDPKKLEKLFVGLYARHHQAVEAEHLSLPRELSDELVAKKYLSGMFKAYLCPASGKSEVSKDDIRSLEVFGEKVGKLRRSVGNKLDGLDPNVAQDEWAEVFRLHDQNPVTNREQILQQLAFIKAQSHSGDPLAYSPVTGTGAPTRPLP